MPTALEERLGRACHKPVHTIRPLTGGCIGEVYRIDLKDGSSLVAKIAESGKDGLTLEGFMLQYLRRTSSAPVPHVHVCTDTLLLMDHIEGRSRFTPTAQAHAAEVFAALHQVRGQAFGFERDTVIGGLPQPNPWTESWLTFFAEQRILYMGQQALADKLITADLMGRLETFCGRLSEWLDEPEFPALLHGDAWTTNILATDTKLTGLIDPALYYGHPEIELAFTTLFNTFNEPFFERYHEISPIKDGFFELRKDLYNLYPLLVHVRLFGATYLPPIDATLKRIGI